MSAVPILKLSVEDYIAADLVSEQRLEYHDGEIFPTAVASLRHASIQIKLGHLVTQRLDGTPCNVIGTMRVRTSPTNYVQPDLIVFCGQPALTAESDPSLTNPKVIFEILSPSTADYDYGGKFLLYRLLPSFEEYVLVAQDQPRVEVFHRMADGKWILSTYEGEESTAIVESLDIQLPLREIYAGLS